MLSKVFLISQKAVNVSKFLSLIADTFKYFHNEGVERGVFTDPAKQNPDA